MEGYSESVDLYTKSLDTAGIAHQKFQLYEEGTESKLNKLKASFESVWMSMFDSKAIQAVITSVNGLVKSISSIVDTFGAFAPVLAVAGISLLAFNGGLKSIMTNGALTIATMKSLATSGLGINTAFTAATLKTRLLGAATTTTAWAVNGLKTAFASTFTFLAGAVWPMAVFAGIGFAIQKVTEAMAKQREEAKKIKQSQDDIVKSYSTHSKQIDELAKQYDSLSARVEDGQLSENSKEYVDNMNSLGKLMPSLVAKTNEHGDSILRSRDAVKDELEYAKQLKEQYDKMSVANFEKDLNAQAEKITKINVAMQGFQNQKNGINTVHGGNKPDKGEQIYYDAQILGQERELQLALTNSKDFIKEKSKAFMEMNGVTGELSDSNNKLIESFIQQAIATKKTVKDGEEFKQFLSDTVNEATTLGEKLAKIPESLDGVFSVKQIQGFSDNQLNAIKAIDDNLKNGGTGALHYKESLIAVGLTAKQADTIIKAMTDALNDNSKAAGEDRIRQQELADAIAKATKQYENSISKIKELSGSLNELNKDHKLSAESISMIADKYPDLLAYIGNEKALREHLTSMIEKEKNVALDAMIAKLQSNETFYKQAKSTNEAYFKGLADYYNVDLGNVTTLAQLKYKVEAGLRDKLGTLWADYYDAQALSFTQAGKDMMSTMSYAEAVNSPQLKVIAEYENRMKQLSSNMRKFTAGSGFSAGINSAITSPSEKDKKSGSSKSTSESTYQTDEFKRSLDEVNAAIEKQQKLQQQYPNYTKQYQNAIKEEIKLQQQKKKLIDEHTKSLQKEIETGKLNVEGKIVTTKIPGKKGLTKADTSKMSAEAQKALDDAKSKLLQLQSDSADVQAKIQELQVEAVKAPMYAAENRFKQIDSQLKILQSQSEKLTSGSKEYEQNLKNQNALLAEKKKLQESVMVGINNELKTNKNLTEAQKLALRELYLTLRDSLIDFDNAVVENIIKQQQSKIDSKLKKFRDSAEQSDYGLQLEKAKGQYLEQGSKEYFQNLANQSVYIQRKIKDTEDEKKAIEELLKTEIKDAKLKEDLRNRYKELNIQAVSLTNEMLDLQNAIKDSYNNIADKAIEAEKEYYRLQKQHLDEYYSDKKRKIQEAYDLQRKLIDDAENTNDYNKELSKKQKEAQDIQNQINKLKLDDSKESQAKVLELQKQLADKQAEIQDFTHKREIDLRKDSLSEQQKLAEDAIDKEQEKWDKYYDEKINDERHWAEVRKQILAGNTKDLIAELKSFGIDVDESMKNLGKSVQENLIDKIKEAVDALSSLNGKSWESQIPTSNTGTPSKDGTPKGSPNNDNTGNQQRVVANNPTNSPTNSGSIEILKAINLWERTADGKLKEVRVLKPGEKYKVYGYDDKFGGQWNVGGGNFVTNMPSYLRKFHDGGVISGGGNRLTELANKLFNAKPNEQVVMALKKELMIPEHNMPNFFGNLKMLTSGLINKGTPSVNTIHFDNLINIDKVDSNVDIRGLVKQTTDELVRQLKPYGFIR